MLNMSSHKCVRMFSFCTLHRDFHSALIFVAIWKYLWIPCLCSPFSSGIHRRPYVEPMWCPLQQVLLFKMLYFAAFYVPSIDIPLCWHRSAQLASRHNAKHADGMRGKSQKKHVNQLWVLMA